MRSHEERVAETKRRIAKMEREKRLRRNTITMASAVAACLALLIGASLAMPGIAASIQTGDYSGFETAASIFHSGAALGYIVIGLLAFLLGVCVTILCFRLRHNTIVMASAVAACLALLIGASIAMPGIAASIQISDYSGFETAASIFHGGAALGYIVIGLLAFLLGVCVTVLCFRLRQMNREDDQNKESEGIHGAD